MKTKTLSQLVKIADKEFSRYVRLRDCSFSDGCWSGECITCSRTLVVVDTSGRWALGNHAGHFVTRGKKTTRWSEENVNLQCAHCNLWMDKVEMIKRYKKALDDKYGKGVWQRLVREGNQTQKPSRDDMEQIIHDSKEYVRFTLAHPNGVE